MVFLLLELGERVWEGLKEISVVFFHLNTASWGWKVPYTPFCEVMGGCPTSLRIPAFYLISRKGCRPSASSTSNIFQYLMDITPYTPAFAGKMSFF